MDLGLTVGLATIFVLAIFDLWVGVANDAANFLNSAIGSRAAKRRIILFVAGLGVFFGALTSNGLMEVARRGVFDPSQFMAADGSLLVTSIIALYLAVMATDVLLLDLFNSFGLPTSTTVSIVSEMVGASIGVALWTNAGGLAGAFGVINVSSVAAIYTGIFMSVVVAFTASALIMFVVRSIYGWDLEKSFRRWGWIWTGAAASAIAYFVLYKGLKEARIIDPEVLTALQDQLAYIEVGTFIVFAIVGAIFARDHQKVLRAIILAGTGALAVAFAGNDLVNFIGPSVAAAQAVFIEGVDLSGDVPTPPWALLIAGTVMTVALVTSRKARRVSSTEVGLASHSANEQSFKAHGFSRFIVRMALRLVIFVRALVPMRARAAIDTRTQPVPPDPSDPPYNLLRASVNLTVSSLLISTGTASGLPLSTTYITFTSAMGAALGDRTWGSKDAPARVAGILTVFGGWLVTGLLAAFGAFVMASLIVLGGTAGILLTPVIVAIGLYLLRGKGTHAEAAPASQEPVGSAQ